MPIRIRCRDMPLARIHTACDRAGKQNAASYAEWVNCCWAMKAFFVTLVVMMIRWYQRVAPQSLRACCRYEPSCSEFMILAVQKYGVVSGVWKGVVRSFRCRQPYGGVDYP